MVKKSETLKGNLSKDNVELFISKAIEKYEKEFMIADALLWRACMNLLEQKYNIKIFKRERK